jgi:hypothetical protein
LKKLVILVFFLVLIAGVAHPGFSRGDKIVPQIAAGTDRLGNGWATIFDITNVSTFTPITNMRVSFYYANGTPWTLQTSLGTANNFQLALQPRQTIRLRAIGGSALETGYAVISDDDPGYSKYSEDYVLGISVFYQVLTSAGPTETVSIPVPEPTRVATVPLEIAAPNIYSAFAIVNPVDRLTTIQLSLFNADGTSSGTKSIELAAKGQRVEFYDQTLFPEFQTLPFKGIAEFVADGPFVLLNLLQTRAADDKPQYALLAPVDKESLRRNSYMVLLQSASDATPYMPLDIDGMAVDFYRVKDGFEAYSWDLEYRYGAPNTTDRFLRPVNSAKIVSLDVKTDNEFDAITMPYLKSLPSYSTAEINVSNPVLFNAFAIRTDLGHYAKARIIRVIETTGDDFRGYKDLVLEVVVFK